MAAAASSSCRRSSPTERLQRCVAGAWCAGCSSSSSSSKVVLQSIYSKVNARCEYCVGGMCVCVCVYCLYVLLCDGHLCYCTTGVLELAWIGLLCRLCSEIWAAGSCCDGWSRACVCCVAARRECVVVSREKLVSRDGQSSGSVVRQRPGSGDGVR